MENTFDMFEGMKAMANIQAWAFDNLFSANHRNAMIRNHGGTQAQIIQIEFNKATGVAEIVN